jgi:hypothetical protein
MVIAKPGHPGGTAGSIPDQKKNKADHSPGEIERLFSLPDHKGNNRVAFFKNALVGKDKR